MSCVVAYKWASNPQDASVGADGVVDWSRAKPSLSVYDAVAIEFGRRFADQTGSELIGVSVGTSAVATSLARKAAASRGLDRVYLVSDDDVANWNATQVGRALARLVERAGEVDLVVTGDASADEGAKLMPTLIAGALGWPCFEEVEQVERTEGGLRLRQSDGGTRTIELPGPAVVSVTTDAATPRVPGMRDILAAAKKPVDVVDLTLEPMTAGHATAVTRRRPEAASREAQVFDGGDAVDRLVAALQAQKVL